MTVSPDLPGFQAVAATDLDYTDPAVLVDVALERAAELLPDWTPREGNVEVVLLEEFAPLLAALVARVEAVVPAVTMEVLALSGLARNEGSPATMTVRFDMSDSLGHVVPAGTTMTLGDPNANNPITATLQADVTVNAGDSNAEGVIVADSVGVVTGLSELTEVVLVDAVAYVESVTVVSVTTAGTDPESDASYLSRGSGWLASMTQLLGRPDQFAARLLVDTRVGRALGVQRWDGVDAATIGADAGAVTVLALAASGAALDSTTRAELEGTLSALAISELTVAVTAPTVQSIDVTGTFTLLSGAYGPTVLAAVEAALAEYLDPLVWPWGEALRLSRLTQVIETVAGVDAVTLTSPADDVVLGERELLTLGTVDLSVA